MTNPNIFDGTTHRPMNDTEYAQWQTDNAEAQAQAEALEAKAVARQALLDRLGLTEQEAQLLLGS
jgi:glycogen synthase